MAELTVELTYGKALYEAARELDKIGLILDELKAIREILQREPDLREFFKTPVLSGPEKKKVIENIFSERICEETFNFLMILIDKKRMSSFGRIVREYEKLVDQERGISMGTIFSVETLTDIQLKSFEEKTGTLLKKKVKLVNKTEPSLLGGVKILVEGKVIDASVRRQLLDLEGRIKQA